VAVLRRGGVVQRRAAHGAQALALGTAQELGGHRERKRVVSPGGEVELLSVDVRAPQPLLLGATGLIDLARVDLDPHLGAVETAHAGPGDGRLEPQPQGVTAGRPGDVDARRNGPTDDAVALVGVGELPRVDVGLDPAALAGATDEPGKIEDVGPLRDVTPPIWTLTMTRK